MRTAMMAMTTSSSISVNPLRTGRMAVALQGMTTNDDCRAAGVPAPGSTLFPPAGRRTMTVTVVGPSVTVILIPDVSYLAVDRVDRRVPAVGPSGGRTTTR